MTDPAKRGRHGGEGTILAIACGLPTLVTWSYLLALEPYGESARQWAYVAGKAVQFSLPAVWVLLVLRKRPSRPRATAGIGWGLGFGAAALLATLVVHRFWLDPAGILSPDSAAGREVLARTRSLGIDDAGDYARLAAFYCLVHSGLEEYYWRWFVFARLRARTSAGTAAVVSSLAFALHHALLLGTFFGWAPAPTLLLSLAVAVGGAFWAGLYHRYGSLPAAWLSHLLVDVGISLVGYFLLRGTW